MQNQHENLDRSVMTRIVICLVILLLAVGGFVGLKSMKKSPEKVVRTERPLKVQVITAEAVDNQIFLTGYGELMPIREVHLSAEVSGRITELHPRLRSGEVIEQGELLFRIDDTDYRTEFDYNRERLEVIEQDLALAQSELKRVKGLFENNQVGSAAGVEQAKKTVNTNADRLIQVRQAITRAKINLERCRVTAPFDGRVVSVDVEAGQYVTPGRVILVVADDSILEVEVPIYGKDAVEWLKFAPEKRSAAVNWFGNVQEVPVRLSWTELPSQHHTGYLHGIAGFSPETRSVRAIVRLPAGSAENSTTTPLVAGMFVTVSIPGELLSDVIRLPRTAVSYENTVYLAKDGRLVTTPVEVIRVQGDDAFVRSGVKPKDLVITTRLINPLEGSKLRIENSKGGE